LLAAVVAEDELTQIDLELSLADAVVGADQPLLEIANSSRLGAQPISCLYGVRQASVGKIGLKKLA
jgi:hypothetical protein